MEGEYYPRPQVWQIFGNLQFKEIGLLSTSIICIIIPIYSFSKLATSLTFKSWLQSQGWIKIHRGPSLSTNVAPNFSTLCLGSSVRCFAKCEGKLAAVAALCTTCHGGVVVDPRGMKGLLWWRSDIFAWSRLSMKLISGLKPQKEVFRLFQSFLPWRLVENWTRICMGNKSWHNTSQTTKKHQSWLQTWNNIRQIQKKPAELTSFPKN